MTETGADDWVAAAKKQQAHDADHLASVASGIGEYGIANACYRLAAILRQHADGDYSSMTRETGPTTMTTATPKRSRRKAAAPERCPACASAGGCDCVKVPGEFRAIGFSGLFHAVTDLEPGAYEAFRDRVPCLIGGDRWVLVSVDEAAMTGVVVRKDAIAIAETFVRPAAL